MVVEVLRFGGREGAPPVRAALDPEGFRALVDGAPAVFVLRAGDLRQLLAHDTMRGRVAALQTQHRGKGLSTYFRGTRTVALEGKYSERGRLEGSVRRYLDGARRAGVRGVHFLGVSAELFAELRRGAADGDLAGVGASAGHSTPGGDELHSAVLPDSLEEEWLLRFSGESREAQELRDRIRLVATAAAFKDVPVLILGPSGSGKEIVARAIHELGRGARGGLWVAVNCAAIPRELLESELFGVEARTVTNVAERVGLWEQASVGRGTLFLNEVAELTRDHQAKLLRALEEGKIRRVGSSREIRVSARVIADTNRDLYARVASGEFRDDLYYRLARLVIRVPGLAQRRADVERTAQEIWREQVTGSPKARLSPEIIEVLASHSWPGGVRELKAVLLTLYLHFYDEVTPGVDQLMAAWRTRDDAPAARWGAAPGAEAGDVARPGASAAAEGSSVRETRVPLATHVEAFRRIRPRYERFAESLRTILEAVAQRRAPLAIVQARAKPVASFAEKAQREEARLGDPLQELRDLCGARIVVQTEDQIREVRAWIERYFEVDASESRVTERPAGPAPGGYPPVRLIARLDRPRAEALTAAVGVEIREEMLGLWAEIEVQTVLEHAWRHVNREMGHDVPLPMPERWSAELRSVGDLLKAVDRSFARIRTGFERYRTTYPAHLGKDELEREIEILANVLACENDARVAVRLGKLAITAGDFGRAIAVLEPHAKAGYPPALRDLGVAICQQQRGSPESAVYERGQAYLEQACAEPHRDPDALCSLAGTWKRRGRHDKALEFYRRALEIDPADPYAVGGVLESELALNRGADIVAALQPSIAGAIERCRDHIAAGVNLPWAYYDLGKFLLLAGQRDDALLVFKRAIDYSTAPFMIQTSLESLDRLAACGEWTGLKEARALLGGSVAS